MFLKNNSEYTKTKKECVFNAGENIVKALRPYIGTTPSTLSNLLRLYPQTYYYAKSNSHELKVLKVPSIDEAQESFAIEDIRSESNNTQVNIITRIRNTDTNNAVEFRNEVRFSHGQFNGTPEAKMYQKSGNLTAAYKRII